MKHATANAGSAQALEGLVPPLDGNHSSGSVAAATCQPCAPLLLLRGLVPPLDGNNSSGSVATGMQAHEARNVKVRAAQV